MTRVARDPLGVAPYSRAFLWALRSLCHRGRRLARVDTRVFHKCVVMNEWMACWILIYRQEIPAPPMMSRIHPVMPPVSYLANQTKFSALLSGWSRTCSCQVGLHKTRQLQQEFIFYPIVSETMRLPIILSLQVGNCRTRWQFKFGVLLFLVNQGMDYYPGWVQRLLIKWI